jgi:hypothetical protein
MRQHLFAGLALAAAVFLGGCAHPIQLTPDPAALVGTGAAPKIERTAVLLMTDAQLAQEVITPGGGGDKVSYKLYKDLQTGIYVALGEVFTRVGLASSPTDPRIGTDPSTVVVTPTITTTSYSPSILTWPPTIFTISLELAFRDPGGTSTVATVRVQGEGRAEFDEFKSDFSLSSKRAAQDVLTRMIKAIQAQGDTLRRWSTAAHTAEAVDAAPH